MSLGKMSVSTASSYHQSDGYHKDNEGEGILYGYLANNEMLSDKPIEAGEWHNLVKGNSADGKYEYIAHPTNDEKEQRGGTDIVFSAPKSVSVLKEVYGDSKSPNIVSMLDSVEKTRIESIRETLDMINERYVFTRGWEDGKQTLEPAKGMFGLFEHHTSRDNDPQTHTHAFLLSRVQRESDGAMRAHENNPILEDQRWIGQYQSSLWASKLEEAKISISYNKDGSFDLAGFPTELMNAFSKGAERIKNKSVALKELYPNKSDVEINKMANLATRPFKDKELTAAGQRNDVWKPEAIALGYTEEKVGNLLREATLLKSDKTPMTAKEAMALSEKLSVRQESVVDKSNFLTTAGIMGHGIDPKLIEKVFNEAVKEGSIIYASHADGYTTKEMVDLGKNTVTKLAQGKGAVHQTMSAKSAEKIVSEYKTIDGYSLTNDQQSAVKMIVTSKDQFMAVYGFAGTGKSTLFRALKEMSVDGNLQGMAITGKASKELQNAGGIKSETVDSFLTKGGVMEKGQTYILDEASFISERYMNTIVTEARRAEARVIFSGDLKQFKALSAGNPFKTMEDVVQNFHIKEIIRQVDPKDREASKMFGEGSAIEAIENLINRGQVIEVKGAGNLSDKIVKDYFHRKDEKILMTPFNVVRHDLNSKIHEEAIKREIVGQKSENFTVREPVHISSVSSHFGSSYNVGNYVFLRTSENRGSDGRIVDVNTHGHSITMARNDGTFLAIDLKKDGENLSVYKERNIDLNAGEKVIFLKNDRHGKWNVTNGDIGTFKEVRNDGKIIFKIGGKDRVAPDNYRYFDRGWVVTDIKAQGASSSMAMGINPDNEASLYVMATRHKQSDGMKLYTEDLNAIRMAAKTIDEKTTAISQKEAMDIVSQVALRDRLQERSL